MQEHHLLTALLALTASFAVPASAQTVTEEAEASEAASGDDEMIVSAERLRGSVPGDIQPEFTIGEVEIGAYGASTLAEVLDAVSTRTGTARGRDGGQPVVLLNGRRVAGFQELRSIPPEAIARVEVYPEEVALKYGYTADQRVINFVLKEDFKATTLEASMGRRGSGAAATGEFEGSRLRLSPKGRSSGDFSIEQQDAVTALERGVSANPTGPDDRALRTLAPRQNEYRATALWNRAFNKTLAGTASLTLGATETASGIGADGATGAAIRSEGETRSAQLGLTLDASTSNWVGTANLSAAASSFENAIVRPAPGQTTVSQSERLSLDGVVNADGALLSLPAGEARLSFRVSAGAETFRAETLQSGLVQDSDLDRTQYGARATLTAPILRRRPEGGVGSLGATLTGAVTDYSDFGLVTALGAGLNWSPTENLRFSAQQDWSENAPTLNQLGDPAETTPGVFIYDPLNGETAPVAVTSGGNPDLAAEVRKDFTLNATWSLKRPQGLTLSGSYVRNRTEDALAAFPAVTAATLAAYPTRFQRDAGGDLIAFDRRPINFAERRSETLRVGAFYFRGFGPKLAPAGAARPPGGGAGGPVVVQQRGPGPRADGPGGRPPGGAGGGPPGGPGGGQMRFGAGPGGGGGDQAGQLVLSLFYTRRLADEIVLFPGQPALDLVSAAPLGGGLGGGPARIEFSSNLAWRGAGLGLSGAWNSPYDVPGAAPAQDLFYDGALTLNVRGFLSFERRPELLRRYPFLKGLRLVARVDNVLDAAPSVRDGSGVVPYAYQKGFQSPTGRTIEIGLRKQF